MRVSMVWVSVAALLFVLGCSGTDPADAYVGTWTFGSFSEIDSGTSCGTGGLSFLIDLAGAMTVTKDDSTDITAAFASNGVACDLGFTVSEAEATAKPGQSCSISDGAMSGAFEVSPGYLNLYPTFLLMSLSGDFVPAGATAPACPLSADEMLTLMPR